MIRINLLPNEDVPRIRSFKMPEIGSFVPVFVAAAVLLICFGTFFFQKRSLDRITDLVDKARTENQKLVPQIARIKQLEREREALDQRLAAITELDRERYLRVHLMSELSRHWPENAWLSEYSEINPGRVEVKGYTFNNFVVADFIRDVSRSDYYRIADLEFSNRGMINKAKVMEFSLTADVSQPMQPVTDAR
jgi:type IV pilus assembly protein PilN